MAINKQNLKVPTSEEARANGKKGGQASAKSRKQSKEIQDVMKRLLDGTYEDADGKVMTGAERLATELFKAATDKDSKNFISAQQMIYRMTGQGMTKEDKKKINQALKLQEKEIELMQKKIDNAEW